jgi:hypothetical protein
MVVYPPKSALRNSASAPARPRRALATIENGESGSQEPRERMKPHKLPVPWRWWRAKAVRTRFLIKPKSYFLNATARW